MVQDDPSVVSRAGLVTTNEQHEQCEEPLPEKQEQELQQQTGPDPTATKIPTVTEISTGATPATVTTVVTTPANATVVMASKCQVRVILDYQHSRA
uniref:Uncharacterized protein n=1 Tax=Anopheles marajoara TaxID=58244 RepID=A0A2M4C4J8_9DIPT